jgi:hypothetical protein
MRDRVEAAVGGGRYSGVPARWRRVQDVFQAALDLPADERPGYLEAACQGDAPLRDEVTSLLHSEAQAGEFIEVPAAKLLAGPAPGRFAPRFGSGDVVGRYEISALRRYW